MSLGSVDPWTGSICSQLKVLIERIEPALVSEHLCWSSFGGDYLNDLAPLPYTGETLAYLADAYSKVQDYLGRQILVENPSSYLEYQYSTYRKVSFLMSFHAVPAAAFCWMSTMSMYPARTTAGMRSTICNTFPLNGSEKSIWQVTPSIG